MTFQDYLVLEKIRKISFSHSKSPPSTPSDIILFDIIRENPSTLAEKAAKNGDYKFISIAMGYHAEENNLAFGMKCASPVETKTIYTGCIPPSAVILKLIKQYNSEILKQPNFLNASKCVVDNEVDKGIENLENLERKNSK